MKMFKIVALFCVMVFSCLSCAQAGIQTGEKAEVFSLTDLQGNSFDLESVIGKKNIVLVFFATWCPHCRSEIPELKNVTTEYKDKDVEIIAVDIQETAKKVKAFVAEHKINYRILMDTKGEIARKYQVVGIPHSVIIDKKGIIRFRGISPEEGLKPFLDRLLKQ